jgi:dTDP-glucose 4,6-dehydratase
LEVIRQIGAGKKKVVYISTDEVYGIVAQGSADEESALKPNSPYSASKASGDLLVRAYNHTYGLGVITTRTSNNFGPYQYPEKLIPLAVTNLMEGKKIPVYGDGLQERDWIYVEDNCSAIALILQQGRSGEIYNIATGQTMTNLSVVEKILERFGKSSSSIEYVKDRPGHDTRYSLSSEKLRKLGWAPRFSFEEGLGKTVSWYQEHHGWWKKIKERKEDFVQYYELQYAARR